MVERAVAVRLSEVTRHVPSATWLVAAIVWCGCGRLDYDGRGMDAAIAVELDVAGLDAPGLDAPLSEIDAHLVTLDAPGLDAPGLDAPGLDAPSIDAPGIDAAPPIDARPRPDIGFPGCDFDEGAAGMGACPAACSGGCMGGVCVIDCEGTDRCNGRTITCPPGWPCEVDCEGIDACLGLTLEASTARSLTLSCDGIDVCSSAEVTCPASADCEILCTGIDACDGASLACGDGDCVGECEDDDSISMTGCSSGACCETRGCRSSTS